ncbi:MAG: N-acetylmuramoyl-L-alanine amidase, partial [Limnochordia bacterium]
MLRDLRISRKLALSFVVLLFLMVCPASAQNTIELIGVTSGEADGVCYVELTMTQSAEYNAFMLTAPERLVVDLEDVVVPDAPKQVMVENGIVKGARVGQYTTEKARVVIDLDCLVGYTVQSRSEGDNQILRITFSDSEGFVQNVTGALFDRESSNARVAVATTGQVSTRISSLKDPLRLVIDLEPAVLVTPFQQLEIGDEAVRGLRLSQYTQDVVRIVLDLAYPLAAVAREWDAATGILPIDLYYRLASLDMSVNEHGVEVIASCSGPMEPSSHLLKEPARFFVDVPGTVPMPGLESSFNPCPPITGVRIAEHLPGQTRLVFDLDYPILPAVTRPDASTLSMVFPTRPVAGKTVTIDPGHGGYAPGAIGPSGAYEKDVVLAISQILEQMLTTSGANVILTRASDINPTWAARIQSAQQDQTDLFISIHANGAIRQQAEGTETFYQTGRDDGRKLAMAVHSELVKTINRIDRGVKARGDLLVLRQAEVPAILVEVAFITHPEEEKLLKDPDFQKQAALGIFLGINQYFGGQRGITYDHTWLPELEPMQKEETSQILDVKLEAKGPSSQWLRDELLVLPEVELLWRASQLPPKQLERNFFILGPLGI